MVDEWQALAAVAVAEEGAYLSPGPSSRVPAPTAPAFLSTAEVMFADSITVSGCSLGLFARELWAPSGRATSLQCAPQTRHVFIHEAIHCCHTRAQGLGAVTIVQARDRPRCELAAWRLNAFCDHMKLGRSQLCQTHSVIDCRSGMLTGSG